MAVPNLVVAIVGSICGELYPIAWILAMLGGEARLHGVEYIQLVAN